jgi:TRAP-type mannitol/chloroaromatic compound transport system permease large subunit
VAPKLPESEQRMEVPDWLERLTATFGGNALGAVVRGLFSPQRLRAAYPQGEAPGLGRLLGSLGVALGPILIAATVFGGAWWYVVIHNAPQPVQVEAVSASQGLSEPTSSVAGLQSPPASGGVQEPPPAASGVQEPPSASGVQEPPSAAGSASSAGLQEPPSEGGAAPAATAAPVEQGLTTPPAVEEQAARAAVPEGFYNWFWGLAAITLLGLAMFYRSFTAENLEVQRLLYSSVMPLALLTGLVLVVILFGITTATESAGVGAAGAFLLAWHSGNFTFEKLKESIYLTAKTTAMVCWLFVGSGLFSAVFALHGGQELIERWLMSMNLTPLQFLMLTQALIFVLGWPLEWTEIIVIFVPIFLPLLAHFQIDPVFFGTLVAVNLQAAFLSPPVAMSAFYLKGVSPPHVTLNQIFAGMMPYMLIVILCMVLMYIFPGMTLWLPEFLYGK